MVASLGYLILRHVLQLIVLGLRGEQTKEVEILVPPPRGRGAACVGAGCVPGRAPTDT